MTWNYSEVYVEYQEASEYLKSSLGITQLDHDMERKVLLPYYNMLVKYLNRKLIELGSDSIKDKVQLVLDQYDFCADCVCEEKVLELAELILGSGASDEEYREERFVFSLADFFSSLRMRLKFQYINLFRQEPSGECCTCGPAGQTEEDYESWTSNVFPNDEEYDRTNYTRTSTPWQVEKTRYCDCYRKNNNQGE